jgi:hypothetical protein
MTHIKSNISNKLEHQFESTEVGIYQFVGRKGEGKLIDLVREASRKNNFTRLDAVIQTEVKAFMYNEGEGKMVFTYHSFFNNFMTVS